MYKIATINPSSEGHKIAQSTLDTIGCLSGLAGGYVVMNGVLSYDQENLDKFSSSFNRDWLLIVPQPEGMPWDDYLSHLQEIRTKAPSAYILAVVENDASLEIARNHGADGAVTTDQAKDKVFFHNKGMGSIDYTQPPKSTGVTGVTDGVVGGEIPDSAPEFDANAAKAAQGSDEIVVA
jgi:hypothetical protein